MRIVDPYFGRGHWKKIVRQGPVEKCMILGASGGISGQTNYTLSSVIGFVFVIFVCFVILISIGFIQTRLSRYSQYWQPGKSFSLRTSCNVLVFCNNDCRNYIYTFWRRPSLKDFLFCSFSLSDPLSNQDFKNVASNKYHMFVCICKFVYALVDMFTKHCLGKQ